MIYYERKGKQNIEDLSSSSSSSALWGSCVENLLPHPGRDGPPHGPVQERKEKKKLRERNGVGGEYESEEEERVRWLFVGIPEVSTV